MIPRVFADEPADTPLKRPDVLSQRPDATEPIGVESDGCLRGNGLTVLVEEVGKELVNGQGSLAGLPRMFAIRSWVNACMEMASNVEWRARIMRLVASVFSTHLIAKRASGPCCSNVRCQTRHWEIGVYATTPGSRPPLIRRQLLETLLHKKWRFIESDGQRSEHGPFSEGRR